MPERKDLDKYTLSRKEGWRRWVDKPKRQMPERLTMKKLAALGEDALDDYNEIRADWHANLLVKTPQLSHIHEQLDLIESSNRQDPDRVGGAAVLDAPGGFGKTTAALMFAREVDRRHRRLYGEATAEGHERIPVFHIRLTSSTTLKTLNMKICQFYGHPGAVRGNNGTKLGEYAVDSVLSCKTQIGIIDDLHLVNPRRRDGADVSNHLKWLANEMPVTFIFAGINLAKKGFFGDLDGDDGVMSQSARRWTRLALPSFHIETDEGRHQWINLLKAVEQPLVLARKRPGMLTDISDYLFARSTGHIGSLMTLLARGCRLATRRGHELLDEDLLDDVINDTAAEKARKELTAGFEAGRLTSAPQRRRKSVVPGTHAL